ncbi:unnamed protein product [Protopolystoma xenopodis]|uniref:Uncharacterized protein n=1 Tax=Protopolystoma xenopodis TaxID=117903 RepID=A0A3S5BGX3_9PLAT|nr:unnamed protein product [Protopolystoma xenopodis]
MSLPHWPRYRPANETQPQSTLHMVLASNLSTGVGMNEERCRFWQGLVPSLSEMANSSLVCPLALKPFTARLASPYANPCLDPENGGLSEKI